jgi:hypothetical protein
MSGAGAAPAREAAVEIVGLPAACAGALPGSIVAKAKQEPIRQPPIGPMALPRLLIFRNRSRILKKSPWSFEPASASAIC